LISVADALEESSAAAKNSGDIDGKYEESSPEKKLADEDLATNWLSQRKLMFLDMINMPHVYKDSALNGSNMSKSKMKKIKQDLAILSNSLPDGIFVRVDENHLDLMKVMIIGPEDSPYEKGCFLFDLYLPDQYPQVHPEMKYLTTGHGTFYFNPNLYQEGYICLSLLGSWDGPAWDPLSSTILQLVVSLQALVFVPYPLENEPGHEGIGADSDSLAYNKGIHMATAKFAMKEYITNPSDENVFLPEIKAWLLSQRKKLPELFAKLDEFDKNVSDNCSYFNYSSSLTEKTIKEIADETFMAELEKMTFDVICSKKE